MSGWNKLRMPLLSVLLAVGLAGAGQAWPWEPIPDDVRAAFHELNFSDVFAQCKAYPIGDAEYVGQWQNTDIQVTDLTPAEQLMLSTLKNTQRDLVVSPNYTFGYVQAFRDIYGTMPRDGLDILMLRIPGYLTAEGWDKFRKLPHEQQAEYLAVGLNPVTGKLYSSFSKPGWEQFGIRLMKKGGSEAHKQIEFPQYDASSDKWISALVDARAWEFTVYGETKGRVVLKSIGWQVLDENIMSLQH